MTGGRGEDIQQTITAFPTVLQQDAQDPYRWVDFGDAFLEAGQNRNAHYSFDQVLVLAPRTAELLLRAADFHFQVGENQEALRITARILALIPDYDSVVFADYIMSVAPKISCGWAFRKILAPQRRGCVS